MERARMTGTIAALILLLPSLAIATTHIVDAGGSGDFVTIQSAVDYATSGDTLRILAGTYEESVVAPDTYLTCTGDGIGMTRLVGVADAPTYYLPSTDPNTPTQSFVDMTIERSAVNNTAVRWNGGHVGFLRCEIVGYAKAIGDPYGSVTLQETSATHLLMDSYGMSTLEGCIIGPASFSGHFYQGWGGGTYCQYHHVESSETEFGSVEVAGCGLYSSDDNIGALDLGYWSWCEVLGSSVGSIWTEDGPTMQLENCTVEGDVILQPQMYVHTNTPTFIVRGCTLHGDLRIEAENESSDYAQGWVELYHNTILGELVSHWSYFDGWVWPNTIRGNIVLGHSRFEFTGLTGWVMADHNDFVEGISLVSCHTDSVHSNLSTDPLMCGASGGDFSLQECSPCVGAAHDGGDMGAYGVGCDCSSAVLPTSWGRIKSLYQ